MFNPMSLKDHHIVVTGAAQGIGEAVARLVVSLGGRVTLVDVDRKSTRLNSSHIPLSRMPSSA